MLPGVYQSSMKNGDIYYRASVTFRGKHISLGSFSTEEVANQAYRFAGMVLEDNCRLKIEGYPKDCPLSFHKWVVLINFRDNHMYFKNPIYLKKRYFSYYLDQNICLRFDAEDLFYYAHHKIMKRGGHLFVSDYGMQVSILSRYGIKNYAVAGKDYLFANGDDHDYSYQNIIIVNPFHGVTKIVKKGHPCYITKIHLNGDYLVGRYRTETEAAIAFNKAALLLRNKGLNKNFPQNYIEGLDEITYASVYQKLRISKKLIAYADTIDNSL
ncbi:MAG: hypothetical protein K0R46_3081 [Herbinix sp.]|nr:hypothetical protein [Herbinix sp.]